MSNESFEEFRHRCVHDCQELQEAFIKLYDLNSYENWFYDHAVGAFHFQSKDGRNLYFKYINVGSYSTKRNTWMWSWENSSVPKHVTRGLEKVKAFGGENNFTALTQGLHNDADEYTGWEFAAVAAKLLNAIGGYRIQQEHLFTHFIFTNELTPEEYDQLKDKYIECESHGSGRVAFVCQHLLGGVKDRGFHEAFESDPATEPDNDYWAWCSACEHVWAQQGEWNEVVKAEANMKIVCDQCYFDIKERNQ